MKQYWFYIRSFYVILFTSVLISVYKYENNFNILVTNEIFLIINYQAISFYIDIYGYFILKHYVRYN